MKKYLFIASEPSDGMLPFAAQIINESISDGNKVFVIDVNRDLNINKYITGNCDKTSIPYPESKAGRLFWKFIPKRLNAAINTISLNNSIDEIVYLTGEYNLALFYTPRLAKKHKLSYYVHDLKRHPDKGESLQNKIFNRYFHLMTKKNIRHIDNLITCSNNQFRSLQIMFPEKNVLFHKFPSLVTEEIKNGSDHCPELEITKPYILFFGNISQYKGVDLLYNAFLDSIHNDRYNLVIAGKGNICFKRRTDEKNVIFINRFIEDSEVGDLFRNATLVVYPYTSITMSGVLSIPHYFGTPVLSSDLDFFIDYSIPSDIHFNCADRNDLISKLNQVLASRK